jgi:hypothetical protein
MLLERARRKVERDSSTYQDIDLEYAIEEEKKLKSKKRKRTHKNEVAQPESLLE